MSLTLTLNGQVRTFAVLEEGADLAALVEALGLKSDRVALEWNGEIVPRGRWGATRVADGDKVELVHFVGGGCARLC